MNYYERYCGDYQRDTAHLSLAEHGAYTMLLDTYFSVERPLPEDLTSLYRVCRAMTRLEQQAVKAVAEQFFPVSQDDGLRHNQRADREIARARPKIEAARINGRKGGRPPKASANASEIRQIQPRSADIPVGLSLGFDHEASEIAPAASTGTHDKPGVEAHQSQHQPQPHHHHHHHRQHELHHQSCQSQEEASVDFKPCETSSPGKAQSQPDMDIHAQEPGLDHGDQYRRRGNSGASSSTSFHVGIASSSSSIPPGVPGACCKALMSHGVTGCNPHHPTLLALLQAGATEEEFVQAARNAAAKGKASFPYVVGTVKRQREEAAKLVLHQGRMPNSQEQLQTANLAATAGWVPPELRNAQPTESAGPAEPAGAEFAEAGGRFSSCR